LCWIPDFDGDRIVNFVDFNYFASNWLSYSYPTEPGMVMAWNAPPDYNSASGWVFEYGDDPNLRNTTVTIDVVPTECLILGLYSRGVVEIVFGDVNGKKAVWLWLAGYPSDPLQANTRTRLTITTNSAGVSTATPQPNSSMVELGFDISRVSYLCCVEIGRPTWQLTIPPPPGGTFVGMAWMWSYLYNLVVTPLPTPSPAEPNLNYFKWRQPARYIGNQGNYWGWDALSVDNNIPPLPEQICADDWLCTDNRPVTGIRWWGSFPNRNDHNPGWRDPNSLPPVAPRGFHIGIWTDSPPANIQDMTMISRPNEMIWEDFCYDYTWKFVGFDRIPDANMYLPTDACYRFYCDLDPNFAQDPNNKVYWLSIAAVYDSNMPVPEYPWGWKTRPHYYQDDAVWITSTQGGEWPPRASVGSRWGTGSQIEFPQWYSWDLSFELVTDVNDP
jgi:hypothetical protein